MLEVLYPVEFVIFSIFSAATILKDIFFRISYKVAASLVKDCAKIIYRKVRL